MNNIRLFHPENIIENTTRFNNEILKQRLSCIPIHISNIDEVNLNNLLLEVNKTNSTESMDYITTRDFKIKLLDVDKYLKESDVKKLFPPNSLTKEYILFARLKPKLSDDLPGEKLSLTAKFSVSNAAVNGMFNAPATRRTRSDRVLRFCSVAEMSKNTNSSAPSIV